MSSESNLFGLSDDLINTVKKVVYESSKEEKKEKVKDEEPDEDDDEDDSDTSEGDSSVSGTKVSLSKKKTKVDTKPEIVNTDEVEDDSDNKKKKKPIKESVFSIEELAHIKETLNLSETELNEISSKLKANYLDAAKKDYDKLETKRKILNSIKPIDMDTHDIVRGLKGEVSRKQKRRETGINRAEEFETEDGLIEARGRPRKETTEEDPGSDNIIMQLRKVISLKGQSPVTFIDGHRTNIPPSAAHDLLTKYEMLRTTAEKHSFASRVHRSYSSMQDVLSGRAAVPEKKNKISLGGLK